MTSLDSRAPLDIVPRRYADDDQIGAANEITPEVVQAGAALIRTGRRYALGQVLRGDSPTQMWRYWRQGLLVDRAFPERAFGANTQTFIEDTMSGALHSGTHLDGLAHVGIGPYTYNGHRYTDIISTTGVSTLGAENIPPIVTRGVLLDVADALGVHRLEPEQAIGAMDLEAAQDRAGVDVRPGDVVILNTGWGELWDTDPARYAASEPGINLDGARWLADRRVTVIGSDTWAVEQVQLSMGELVFPVHQECITRNGIYLLENVRTTELVTDGVSAFCCIIAPTRLAGASGSMVGPVAVT